jgi:hypothetical protein
LPSEEGREYDQLKSGEFALPMADAENTQVIDSTNRTGRSIRGFRGSAAQNPAHAFHRLVRLFLSLWFRHYLELAFGCAKNSKIMPNISMFFPLEFSDAVVPSAVMVIPPCDLGRALMIPHQAQIQALYFASIVLYTNRFNRWRYGH